MKCMYMGIIMGNRARGTGLESARHPSRNVVVMYGMSARPLIECGFRWFFVVPLVPHRDCSGAYLLYHRIVLLVPHGNRSEAYLSYCSIGLELVYAQSGNFHS